MKRVLVVGEPLVELLEEPTGTIRRGFGGDALNLAVYLARESPTIHVILVTAVGSDPDSDALIALCRDEGIDGPYIHRVVGAELGRYRVTVDRSGERAFTYERSQSPFRDALAGDEALPDPRSIDALCFSGIAVAVLRHAGRRTLLAYTDRVQRAGGMVVYDPNHRPALWGDDADALEWTARMARLADVFIASAEDGRRLTDADATAEIARSFHAMGAREVVVTDGQEPCVVAFQDTVSAVDACTSVPVIDTTAAGDAFDAGYIAARLRGETPEGSAVAGHALAATVVGHRGALAPRPTIT